MMQILVMNEGSTVPMFSFQIKYPITLWSILVSLSFTHVGAYPRPYISLVSLDASWWSFAVQEKLLVANQITTLPPQESEYHTQFILPPNNCQMWILSNSFENAAFETVVQTPIKSLRPSVAEAHELLSESSFIGFWAVFRFFNWCFNKKIW